MYNVYNEIKSEIERSFWVLGTEKGFDQNLTDLIQWREDGYITESEYSELRSYNRTIYKNSSGRV